MSPGPSLVLGEREPFGFDEYVTRFPAGGDFVLRVDSPEPKPSWRTRIPGDQLRTDHPGTPVLFEDRWLEVLRYEEIAAGDDRSARHCYYLAEWDDLYIMGPPTEYSRESLAREIQESTDRSQRDQKAQQLGAAGLLVALLPAAEQRRLANEFGFDAERWTRRSAMLMIFLVSPIIIFGVPVWGSGPGGALMLLGFGYLLLESAMRWASSLGREPAGSVLGWIWFRLTDRRQT